LKSNTNSSNTSIGYFSLINNTSGDANFAGGAQSLSSNTTGRLNVSLGFASMQQNTTGSFNIAVGDDAGRFISGGGNNAITNNSIYIGSNTRPLANNQTNQIVIGHNAIGGGSNTVVIGNDSITSNQFKGNLETSRSSDFIRLSPNNGTANLIQGSGSVPLHILTSNSLGLGVGSTPQVTIASGGAVTLTGALNGTSASFTGDVQTSTRLIATNSSNSIILTPNLAGTTNRIESLNLPLEIFTSGSELKLRAGAGNAQVTLASTGAVTLTGALNGTSASFTGNLTIDTNTLFVNSSTNMIGMGTTSPTDFGSGYTGLSIDNVGAGGGVLNLMQGGARKLTIAVDAGNVSFAARTSGESIVFRTNDGTIATRLTLASTGAATFSSSVNAGTNIESNNGYLSASAGSGLAYSSRLSTAYNFPFVDTYLDSLAGASYDGRLNFRIQRNGGSISNVMTILPTGNVGIGTTDLTSTRLRIKSTTTGSSNFVLYTEDSSANILFWVRDDGLINTGLRSLSPVNNTTAAAANVWINTTDGTLGRSTSSIKYKKNVEDYNKGLNEVMKLRPVIYEGISEIDSDKIFAGLIAEEVHELGLKEFVQYAEDGTPDALAYSNMVSLLIKAIQEQQEQIDSLKNQIK
jgi:hypothetical protein